MSKANEVIDKIEKEVGKYNKPENLINYQRWFKEKLEDPIGLRGPYLKKVSNAVFKEYKDLSKKEILDICDAILKSGIKYNRFFAFDWAEKIENQLSKPDFARFERWVKDYVENWGHCDSICCGALGKLIARYPELSKRPFKWTTSKNRWLRRAAAVSLIPGTRKGLFIDDVFKTAERLLMDEDDLVQKGYGWMLKDSYGEHGKAVYEFITAHKDRMPRTALRYALERYPKDKRKKAMAK